MAALDVLTLAEAKAAINLSGSSQHDAELPAWITGVSRRLDRAVGPIVQRTITAELHDGGDRVVRTRFFPVASFTSVTEYVHTTATVLTRETNALKPADAYLAEPYGVDPTFFSGAIYRRAGGSRLRFASGESNIEITYVGGRATATTSVDELFKRGAALMLSILWASQRPNVALVGEFEVPQSNFPRFVVPNAVHDLLSDWWQEGVVFG